MNDPSSSNNIELLTLLMRHNKSLWPKRYHITEVPIQNIPKARKC